MNQTTPTARTLGESGAQPVPDSHEAAAPPSPPVAVKKAGPRRLILAVIVLAALGFGAREGYSYWTTGRFMISTDDAYLKTDITAIAPKVQGYIGHVAVHENQKVKVGDVLMTLDDGDYRNALKIAQSKVATQTVTIQRIAAQVAAAQASVAQAEAQTLSAAAGLKNAELKYSRTEALTKSSVAAQSALDDVRAALDQAKAAAAGADASVAAAKANVAVLEAQRSEAQSQLGSLRLAVDQAQRDLGHTVLRAPVAGTVANISARVGDLVSPGQKIAAVVPTDALYITANYKETQLDGIAPGESARVTIDALPGRSFTATVTSVAPATGSEFALLPAQNATGNFTKVVQRVPVRLTLPAARLASGKLQAGLSAVVEIDSRSRPGN